MKLLPITHYQFSNAICEWFNTLLVDKYGDVVRFASIAQDISDRFNAEKAFQENEKKYRTVVDNVKEVIFQTDARSLFEPLWIMMFFS